MYMYKKSHYLLCRLAVYAGYADGTCDEKQIVWMCQTLNNKLKYSFKLTLFHYRFGRNF